MSTYRTSRRIVADRYAPLYAANNSAPLPTREIDSFVPYQEGALPMPDDTPNLPSRYNVPDPSYNPSVEVTGSSNNYRPPFRDSDSNVGIRPDDLGGDRGGYGGRGTGASYGSGGGVRGGWVGNSYDRPGNMPGQQNFIPLNESFGTRLGRSLWRGGLRMATGGLLGRNPRNPVIGHTQAGEPVYDPGKPIDDERTLGEKIRDFLKKNPSGQTQGIPTGGTWGGRYQPGTILGNVTAKEIPYDPSMSMGPGAPMGGAGIGLAELYKLKADNQL